jgi:Lipoprotein LpqB beta-propeller domain/Sporulation and spore germination
MRTPARVTGLLVTAALLASCAQVPTKGPVVEAGDRGQVVQTQLQYSNPKGPQPGQSPTDVVNGFLVAMTATPLTVRTAQKFLSKQARTQWRPQRVISYIDHSPARGTHDVVVRLSGADQVGADGRWKGSVPAAERRLQFPMVREDNQWRIDAVPDALIVPRTFYDQQYTDDTQIYFFDPTARILVPEPVHIPQGSLVSSLVRALVRGPSPSLSGVARTFVPPGLAVNAVPVSKDGVALVTLRGRDPGPLSSKVSSLVIAQLGWTLRQDPAIRSFRVSIAGHPLTDTAGAQAFRVPNDLPGEQSASHRYDPAVNSASVLFYALRRGLLVSGSIDRPSSVNGPFGNARQGIGPFAVRLDGNQVAGVTSDALVTGPVVGPEGPNKVLSGGGLLRPAWDFAGRLWDIQNVSGKAGVVYLDSGRRHEVRIPGITGEDVRRFLVSRDGSRLVAVLRGRSSDRIVVSRLRYDGAKAVGSRARPIPWLSSGTTLVRDIGWTSPTTIAVLDQLSRSQAEVRILNVDGSMPPDQAPPTLVNGRVSGLVSSPNQAPYAVQADGITDISRDSAQALPNPQIPTQRLRHLTYAG